MASMRWVRPAFTTSANSSALRSSASARCSRAGTSSLDAAAARRRGSPSGTRRCCDCEALTWSFGWTARAESRGGERSRSPRWRSCWSRCPSRSGTRRAGTRRHAARRRRRRRRRRSPRPSPARARRVGVGPGGGALDQARAAIRRADPACRRSGSSRRPAVSAPPRRVRGHVDLAHGVVFDPVCVGVRLRRRQLVGGHRPSVPRPARAGDDRGDRSDAGKTAGWSVMDSTASPGGPSEPLTRLAAAHGVATDYWDWQGRHAPISAEHDRGGPGGPRRAARIPPRQVEAVAGASVGDRTWRRVLPATVVCREGWTPWVAAHVPHGTGLRLSVDLEGGGKPDRSGRSITWSNLATIDGVLTGEATFELRWRPAARGPGISCMPYVDRESGTRSDDLGHAHRDAAEAGPAHRLSPARPAIVTADACGNPDAPGLCVAVGRVVGNGRYLRTWAELAAGGVAISWEPVTCW